MNVKYRNKYSLIIVPLLLTYSVGELVPRVELFDKKNGIESYVRIGTPVVFTGAASDWGAVRNDGMNSLLDHFDRKMTFFFDVAPKRWDLLTHGNFTFAPAYNGHGYALEDICKRVKSDLDSKYSKSYEIFFDMCHGSSYSTKRMSMPSFLSHRGPPLFAKLGPANIPQSLKQQFHPDSAFLLHPDDPRDLDLWIGSKGWRSATHYDLQHNAYVQVSINCFSYV